MAYNQVSCGYKNEHQEDMCGEEIWPHAQLSFIVLGSIGYILGHLRIRSLKKK